MSLKPHAGLFTGYNFMKNLDLLWSIWKELWRILPQLLLLIWSFAWHFLLDWSFYWSILTKLPFRRLSWKVITFENLHVELLLTKDNYGRNVWNLIWFLAQLWKLDSNNTLVNKRNIWQSSDTWNFSAEENFRIEKYSNSKVLGATIHGKVIEQNFVENKAEQLWKKGVEDDEGYFTLKNFENSKLMTAISKYGLETKGN